MVLVADGSEEIEVLTAYDVFMRASLSPVIISVSPQFSPSQSLPYITLSRGAKLIADTTKIYGDIIKTANITAN